MHKCTGCGTTGIHADDCPALDVTPHPEHAYPFGTSYRECPGYPRKGSTP